MKVYSKCDEMLGLDQQDLAFNSEIRLLLHKQLHVNFTYRRLHLAFYSFSMVFLLLVSTEKAKDLVKHTKILA